MTENHRAVQLRLEAEKANDLLHSDFLNSILNDLGLKEISKLFNKHTFPLTYEEYVGIHSKILSVQELQHTLRGKVQNFQNEDLMNTLEEEKVFTEF